MPLVFRRSAAARIAAAAGGGNTLTVTFDMALESSDGNSGGIAWQTAFLLADGRICSFGTGDHSPESSNAMKIIDPVSVPGSLSTSVMFPWTQSGGNNLYVSVYDNHPSIYIPSDNKVVWVNHGVFDFAGGVQSWTYGDRSPNTQGWTTFVDISAVPTITDVYNPATAWCSALDLGVWYGNSPPDIGQANDRLGIIERNSPGAPWKYTNSAPPGAVAVEYSRNTAVVVGTTLYVAGFKQSDGSPTMQSFNLNTRAVQATLSAPPFDAADNFPQMVYDSRRSKFIVIGRKLLEYDIAGNSWTNITPGGWPGYDYVNGVYQPTVDAIFYRGVPVGAGIGVVPEKFRWHRLKWT